MSGYCTEQVITHKTLITSNYPTKTFRSFLHFYTDNSTMSYSKMSNTSSPKIGSFSRSSFKPFLRTCSAFLDKVYQSTDTSVEATRWKDLKDQGISRGPSFNTGSAPFFLEPLTSATPTTKFYSISAQNSQY